MRRKKVERTGCYCPGDAIVQKVTVHQRASVPRNTGPPVFCAPLDRHIGRASVNMSTDI